MKSTFNTNQTAVLQKPTKKDSLFYDLEFSFLLLF